MIGLVNWDVLSIPCAMEHFSSFQLKGYTINLRRYVLHLHYISKGSTSLVLSFCKRKRE